MLFLKGFKYTTDPLLVFLGVIVGGLKGQVVFSKTVDKFYKRISSYSSRVPFSKAFPISYIALIAVMVGLGFVLNFFPDSIHGTIDIAVGFALFIGSIHFFRKM